MRRLLSIAVLLFIVNSTTIYANSNDFYQKYGIDNPDKLIKMKNEYEELSGRGKENYFESLNNLYQSLVSAGKKYGGWCNPQTSSGSQIINGQSYKMPDNLPDELKKIMQNEANKTLHPLDIKNVSYPRKLSVLKKYTAMCDKELSLVRKSEYNYCEIHGDLGIYTDEVKSDIHFIRSTLLVINKLSN